MRQKEKDELIASLAFIVIGLFSLFENFKGGVLLIVLGFGVSSQVREWAATSLKFAIPSIKRFFDKSGGNTQEVNRSEDSVSVQQHENNMRDQVIVKGNGNIVHIEARNKRKRFDADADE